MSGRVLVIGAGIAGLAAAFRARSRGLETIVVGAGAGASALGGGAVDDVPWEERRRAMRVLGGPLRVRALGPEVVAFSEALGLWDLPAEGASTPLLATVAGRLRPARGRDRGLLDLASLPEGARVVLPRAPRGGWDADAIARTLEAEPLARRAGLRFQAVDIQVLRYADEARINDGDLAMRHDDPARLAWLAERLREGLARAGAGAVLLGSWLGVNEARAAELSSRVGVPVGEALVGIGSAAGLRFEAARDRLLASLRAEVVIDRAAALASEGGRVTVKLVRGGPLSVDAVVLAVGGLAGGGVVYAPPEHEAGDDLPPRGAVPYRLSVDMPASLSVGAGPLNVVASMQGPELDVTAWPTAARAGALEAIGVYCTEGRVAPGVTAAGDVVAGRPRTLLEAVASGLRAVDAAGR
nr:anaerobic glycerol-3-phosphate dehydrogenase subunit B [Myxococcales bacterium]